MLKPSVEKPPASDQSQDVGDLPTIRSVSRDALLYIPGRGIPAVVQVLTVTLLTHYFTRDEIGRYDLTFRFILFLSTFTFLWLNMGILRFYSGSELRGQTTAFFGVMGCLKYGAILFGLILGGAAYFWGPDWLFGSYRDLLGAGLVVFVAYTLYETGLAVLRAKRKPLVYSIATTLSAGLRLPAAMALFWWQKDISGMLWAMAGTYFLAHLLVVRKYVGYPHGLFRRGERELLKEVLIYGIPIWLTQVLNFLMVNSDRYMLKMFHGDGEVGLYSVATNLIDQPMTLVFQTFGLAVFPSVAAAWERQGRVHTEYLVAGVTRVFFLMCVPLMVMLSVLSQPIFSVLAHGDSFVAYRAAYWVSIASFFFGLSYFANFGLHLSKRTHVLLAVTVFALVVNVACNYLLIPWKGFIGAGISRTISNVLLVLFVWWAGRGYLRWQLSIRSLARIAAAAAITGLSLWYAKGWIPTNIVTLAGLFAGGGCLYILLLLLLREVPMEEVRRIIRRFHA